VQLPGAPSCCPAPATSTSWPTPPSTGWPTRDRQGPVKMSVSPRYR